MPLTEKELAVLRGKSLVGDLTKLEIDAIFSHITCLEDTLDEADDFDALGTEGWRHYLGIA